MKKAITMDLVITGLRFIAENRNLSTDDLADGLEKLGCNWTFDDWDAQFDKIAPLFFEGVKVGAISSGAIIILNVLTRDPFSRSYVEGQLLSVDDERSIYHFVRLVTGDSSFTKVNLDHLS